MNVQLCVFLGVDAGKPPADLVEKAGDSPDWRVLVDAYYKDQSTRLGRNTACELPELDTATLDYFGLCEDSGWNLIGCYIAGKDEFTPLNLGFAMSKNRFLDDPNYHAACGAGFEVLTDFLVWAKTRGYNFPEPDLWMVYTEV